MVLGFAKLLRCRTIIMLPGWKHSTGAKAEFAVAVTMKMNLLQINRSDMQSGAKSFIVSPIDWKQYRASEDFLKAMEPTDVASWKRTTIDE